LLLSQSVSLPLNLSLPLSFPLFPSSFLLFLQHARAHARRRARVEHKLEWVLHIDGDELFYTPSMHVAPHFSRLHREAEALNIWQVCKSSRRDSTMPTWFKPPLRRALSHTLLTHGMPNFLLTLAMSAPCSRALRLATPDVTRAVLVSCVCALTSAARLPRYLF
jgi:hypothetical protein